MTCFPRKRVLLFERSKTGEQWGYTMLESQAGVRMRPRERKNEQIWWTMAALKWKENQVEHWGCVPKEKKKAQEIGWSLKNCKAISQPL